MGLTDLTEYIVVYYDVLDTEVRIANASLYAFALFFFNPRTPLLTVPRNCLAVSAAAPDQT